MKNNQNEESLEEEPSALSPGRLTEESGLKSNLTKSYNNESINSSNNNNNTSHTQLNEENSLNLNDNINNNSEINSNSINHSRISRRKQIIIFIPIVLSKILISIFFFTKYLVHSFENEEDINYCKYSFWILASLVILCYFLTIFAQGNQTKVDKYFDQVKNNVLAVKVEDPGNELQDLNSAQWSHCLFCKSKKFIRSSHCRTCNKCILLRDHHCPYIAGCVGFNNMQYFINFLFWAEIGFIFYDISFIKFQFFSKARHYIVMPLYLKILFYVDFFLALFFTINLFGIMSKLFINIYNNRTQLENMRTANVEYYCPICPRCVKDYRRLNIDPEINFYNIGFLANLYYIIGPTPFHFIFPLPKYKNYLLNENCPIFKQLKIPERLQSFKFMIKKDHNNINMLENDDSNPNAYVKACHKCYDGKKII